MRRLKSLRLVVSHTHLYRKLEEYGNDYDGSVTSMMGQERDWMESQLPTPANESEESEGSESSDDSFTENNSLPKSNTRHTSQPNGQKFTIDNIDYRQEVHHMTQEHQAVDKHYLTVCATKNRIHGNHLSTVMQADQLSTMENGKCIPSRMEQISQRDNYIQLVERVLVQNISCLQSFKDVVVHHIPHMYSKETKEPTDSVSTDGWTIIVWLCTVLTYNNSAVRHQFKYIFHCVILLCQTQYNFIILKVLLN
jgi:hypothetical protein